MDSQCGCERRAFNGTHADSRRAISSGDIVCWNLCQSDMCWRGLDAFRLPKSHVYIYLREAMVAALEHGIGVVRPRGQGYSLSPDNRWDVTAFPDFLCGVACE